MRTLAQNIGVSGLVALLFSAPALAQKTMPDANSIYRIDVVLFEHTNSKVTVEHTVGLQDFSTAIEPSITQASPNFSIQKERAVSREWSFEKALATWEALALASTATDFVGPTLPPSPSTPQLNFPRLWTDYHAKSRGLKTVVQRLENSSDHRVLRAWQWHQSVARNQPATPVHLPGNIPTPRSVWLPAYLAADGTPPPGTVVIDGILTIRRDQFLRIDATFVHQQLSRNIWGPWKAEALYPTGVLSIPLRHRQVITPGQWVYLDSPKLGLLLRATNQTTP